MSYLRDKFKKIEEGKEGEAGAPEEKELSEEGKGLFSRIGIKGGGIKLLLWSALWVGMMIWVTWAIMASYKNAAKYF